MPEMPDGSTAASERSYFGRDPPGPNHSFQTFARVV